MSLLVATMMNNSLAADISLKIEDSSNLSVLAGVNNEENSQSVKELIIPQVDKVGDSAFRGNEDIEVVKFADHSLCHTIGKMAFLGCSSLKSFKFGTGGKGVERIEDKAFYNCSNLSEIDFPYILKTIGAYAFNGCDGLTSIDLSGEIQELGDFAFALCEKLEEVKFGHNLSKIGASAFFGCEKLNFTDLEVNEIGISAFENCTNLKQIKLASVKVIGETAFRGCTVLKSVILPDTTEVIGENAFAGCSSLESIYIGIQAFYYAMKNDAFQECDKLKNINVQIDSENSITLKKVPGNWDDFLKKILKKQIKQKVIELVNNIEAEKVVQQNEKPQECTKENEKSDITAPKIDILDLTKENKLASGDLKAIKVIKMPFATFENFFKINPFDAFPNLECVIVAYTGDQLNALQSMNIYKEYGFSVSAKDDNTVTYLLDSTVKSLLLNTTEFSNMLKNDEFAKYNNLDEIRVVGTKELIKKIKKSDLKRFNVLEKNDEFLVLQPKKEEKKQKRQWLKKISEKITKKFN